MILLFLLAFSVLIKTLALPLLSFAHFAYNHSHMLNRYMSEMIPYTFSELCSENVKGINFLHISIIPIENMRV